MMARSPYLAALAVLSILAPSVSARRLGFLHRYKDVQEQLDFYGAEHDVEDGLDARLQWFEQKLDHFNPACTATWLQRYAVRTKYYDDNNLVFLFIEGEGVIRKQWLKHGHMGRMADKFSAAEFIIEHRFYGGSKPKPDLSLDSLKYLSSEQALADLAHFIRKMNVIHGFNNPKWIVFGGSYAGSLAAWLRYKYPHLVFAAVSSSGPLHAKADFPEYLQTVTNSLVSVTPKCVDAIKTANQKLSAGMRNDTKREHYRELFRLCDPLAYDDKDIATFFELLTDNIAYVVQYNRNRMNTDSDRAYIDMDAVCKIMTDESIHCPVHRYAEVNKLLLTHFGQQCADHKYNSMVDYLRSTSYGLETNNFRQWFYQTCTEFGWYQTSNNKDDVFGDKIPVQYFIDLCTDVYGPSFNNQHVNASTEETNTNYGGYTLPVSRVIFVHGSVDPWSPLGITSNPPDGSYAIFIKGVAHCASMLPETRDDPPQLTEAREKIEKIVGDLIIKKNHSSRKRTFVFGE
nr:PREDICTED: putative serine protease K12H4.7 [Bemisia tabaci]